MVVVDSSQSATQTGEALPVGSTRSTPAYAVAGAGLGDGAGDGSDMDILCPAWGWVLAIDPECWRCMACLVIIPPESRFEEVRRLAKDLRASATVGEG